MKYKVQYKPDSTGAPWISKRINAVNTAITITGLSAGTTYRWKVRNICTNEQSDYSAPAFFTTSLKLENASASETSFDVYPNPFTSTATVSFYLNSDAHTLLEAFDLAGRKTVLLYELLHAGNHEITMRREQLGEGLFFIQLISGDKASVVKVLGH